MKINKRCGGWDEYNHNIFVQIWNKNFGDNVTEVPDKKEHTYRKFKAEVCQKIFGKCRLSKFMKNLCCYTLIIFKFCIKWIGKRTLFEILTITNTFHFAGINTSDIHSHTQWYKEYLNLKKCQETALNKWRENKRKIKYPNKVQRKNVKYEISKADSSPNNESGKKISTF